MKKSFIFWMFAILMMAVGMSSCSSDDNFVTNPNEDEPIVQKDYFYYYNGNKMPLTLNENNYCLHVLKECDEVR